MTASAVVAVLCVVGLSACSGTSNNSNTAANDSQSSNEFQKVQVVASFYPMADFAQKIGGEHVEVTNLCPAGTEPHEWEPSPSDVKSIEGADVLDREFSEQLSQTSGKTIVVSHEAFGYLCDAYGLTQEPITGMDAEGEPDAKAMAEIVQFVRDRNVKVIFSEDLVSPKVAQQIADETGASCEVLNPVEGLEQDELDAGEDYFSVMRDNLKDLVSALNQQ